MSSEPSPNETSGTPAQDADVLVSIRNLRKHYPITGGLLNRKKDEVKAVDGVDFDIYQGETLGIVGESGCGKTTLMKTVLRLLEPTEGTISYRGQDITTLSDGKLRDLREDIGVVYQDPFSSLNPHLTIRKIISEPLRTHRDSTEQERTARVEYLLERVGLSKNHKNRYPHEFSGGQRQRIAIARALALEPSFVILDEPTSALDVSVQAKILNLLDELQTELGLTYLFITHDLNVMRHIADRLLVMYLGQVMELGDAEQMFESPHHPYTEALLSAIPKVSSRGANAPLEGDVPSPRNPPTGCVFHTRCPYATGECSSHEPDLNEVTPDGESQWKSHCLYSNPRVSPPEQFPDYDA